MNDNKNITLKQFKKLILVNLVSIPLFQKQIEMQNKKQYWKNLIKRQNKKLNDKIRNARLKLTPSVCKKACTKGARVKRVGILNKELSEIKLIAKKG